MNRQLRLLFVVGLFLLTSSRMVFAQPSIDLAAVDQFLEDQRAANRIPGMAVAITQGGDALHLRGYGTDGNGQPITPQTQFYIASLSKSFTALAVMQLVEDGQIDLDAPVQTYVPEFTTADAERTREMTVRHLLNQVSGLSDLGFPAMTLPQPSTIEERIASLRTAHLVSEPGTEFHYTDTNYAVLARVVETTSGAPFSQYLQEHVFIPLRMTHTVNVMTSAETPSVTTNLAQGHILAFSIAFPREESIGAQKFGYLGGSGGVNSTAEDMANFLTMHNNGGRFAGEQLVSPDSIELMHTPPPNVDSPYAMGWMVLDENASPRVIEHNGILSAFHADMALLPDQEYGIVLLYNVNNLLIPYENIRHGLIALLMDQPPDVGGLNAGALGIIIAVVTLVTLMLQIRALLRLPRWSERTRSWSFLRLLPGLIWAFVPAALWLALPSLTARFSDRVFSYEQQFASFPDIFIWLTVTAALGVLIGIAHLILMLRRSRQ